MTNKKKRGNSIMRLALPNWDYCHWQVLTPRTKISKPVLGPILIAPTDSDFAKTESAGQVFFSFWQTRLIWQKKRRKIRLASGRNVPIFTPCPDTAKRLFIEAEKRKLTRNLTFNLRCHRNVWSVRQWSFRGASSLRPGLPANSQSNI